MRTMLLMTLLAACGGGAATGPGSMPSAEERLTGHRDAVKLEDRDINLYVERHGLLVQKSGTGVRHQMLRDAPGEPVRPDEWAQVRYRVELLSGETAYESDAEGPESFLVEMDNVESGLHEGIQHLSPGDSAIIIIPSYRAHGLIGDLQRVPPRSTIVYRIALTGVKR